MKIHIKVTKLPLDITLVLQKEIIAQGFEVIYFRSFDEKYLETDASFDFNKTSPIYQYKEFSAEETWMRILRGEHSLFYAVMKHARGEECQEVEVNGETFML